MRFDLFLDVLERRRALAAADDLAVPFGSEEVNAERIFGIVLVDLKIESLDGRREVMHKDRLPELARKIRLVRCAKITAPFEVVFELPLGVTFLEHFHRVV